MRNRRFPNYPNDADYTTNSPSYYDDLARKQKLIQLLAEKIWDYDDEIKEYFKRWEDNLENINEDVIEMLIQWSEDGTLDHIINDTIFSWKADKTYVDDLNENVIEQLTLIVKEIGNLQRKQNNRWLDLIEDFDAKADGTDDSIYFQNALNGSIGRTLYIPKQHGDHYLIGGIDIPSNTYIIMEQGVKIKSKYLSDDNRMVNMNDVENITIEGNGSTFFMDKTQYTGEQNHIFHINGSTNVSIFDVNANDSGGDGFYISNTNTVKTYSENVRLIRCNADNNRRNNLSVISVDGLYVDTCNFTNASGAEPQCGVDVEPNKPSDRLKNIRFKNCKSINNVKEGFRVLLWNQDYTSEYIDILFEGCYSKGDNNGFIVKYSKDGTKGIVRVKDCVSELNEYNGFNFTNCSGDGVDIELENCIGLNANTLTSGGTSRHATYLIMDDTGNQPSTIGNVKMTNCQSIDSRYTPLITRGFVINNNSGTTPENVVLKNCTSIGHVDNPFDLNNDTEKCTVINDIPYIFKKNTTGNISIAHHNGQICTNEGSTGSIRLTLVETKDDAEITFRVATEQPLRIFPQATNQIVPLTTTLGKGLECSTVGSSITLKAIGDKWVVTKVIGDWIETV